MLLFNKSWSFYLMLIAAVLAIVIGLALVMMHNKNKSISHPLPITHDDQFAVSDDTEDVKQQTITVVASPELKQPLEGIIDKFSRYYPYITVSIDYIDPSAMQRHIVDNPETHVVLTDESTMSGVHQLKQTGLDTSNQNTDNLDGTDNHNSDEHNKVNEVDSAPPFDFAITKQDDNQGTRRTIQGYVVNPDNAGTHHAVVLFKRFLLASSVQKLLKDSDLESIETHDNSVEYLFSNKKGNNEDVAEVSINEMIDTD